MLIIIFFFNKIQFNVLVYSYVDKCKSFVKADKKKLIDLQLIDTTINKQHTHKFILN